MLSTSILRKVASSAPSDLRAWRYALVVQSLAVSCTRGELAATMIETQTVPPIMQPGVGIILGILETPAVRGWIWHRRAGGSEAVLDGEV